MQPINALTLEQIDLSDIDFWARPWSEREGAFATLRSERPMPFFAEPNDADSPIPLPVGPGYYALTKHRDVTEVSRKPEIFCSGQGAVSIQDLPPEMVEYFSGMISTDNPRHARLRRIVSNAFNPRRVKAIEDSIEEVAAEVVNRVKGDGGCDFVVEVAARLPLKIICDMMGVPESQYDAVFRCSNIILSMGDPEYVTDVHPIEAFIAAGAELQAIMAELGVYRRENPIDDITSALVNSSIDGESLTDQELASFFVLLVTAGNETTRTAIAHGLNALTLFPEQRSLWQANFDTHSATAVEEIIRWASPVIWMRRTVTQDTVLSETELKAGDKLLLFYNSANRDEEVFDDPYRFDITRDPNPHVGFGAAGPHFCLGAHLARREVAVMFRELFTQIPDIRATSTPDQLRSSFVNGIKHMDCEFTPVK
ncbi:MAG: cytochrome P450 [Actinomycetes bacterium]